MKSGRRVTSTSKFVCCATWMLKTSRSARRLPALVSTIFEGGGVTGDFTNALPTRSTHGRERSTNSVHDKGSSLRGPSHPPRPSIPGSGIVPAQKGRGPGCW
jgi:hypothetical protein